MEKSKISSGVDTYGVNSITVYHNLSWSMRILYSTLFSPILYSLLVKKVDIELLKFCFIKIPREGGFLDRMHCCMNSLLLYL